MNEIQGLAVDKLYVEPEPDELVEAAEDEDDAPITPTIDTRQRELEEKEVAYASTRRHFEDVVLSGPIIGGWGPGRYFQNRARAHAWCNEKYGAERVRELEGRTRGRWSFLIKNLKEVVDVDAVAS